MTDYLLLNGIAYQILKLLGKGKGGYSYLVQSDDHLYVLKQIHHEPCDYYTFGDKIATEKRDYELLKQTGIRIPKMLDIDMENERILKEYIAGPTIYELVKNNQMKDTFLIQMQEMAHQVYSFHLNIDYFPTNLIVKDDLLYYIDYECNPYSEEWNFENWGIKYWSQTPEFLEYEKRNRHT